MIDPDVPTPASERRTLGTFGMVNRNRISALQYCAAILILATAAHGCGPSDEDIAFNKIQEHPSPREIENFLSLWPKGPRSDQARQVLKELEERDLEQAELSGTVEAIRNYYTRWPAGTLRKIANRRLGPLFFGRALALSDIELLREFKERFPYAIHKGASWAIHNLVWESCNKEETIDCYTAYLAEFPDGSHSKDALFFAGTKFSRLDLLESYLSKYSSDGRTYSRRETPLIFDQYKQVLNEFARRALEELTASPSLPLCESYMQYMEDWTAKSKPKVNAICEPLVFESLVQKDSVSAYREYLANFTTTPRKAEVDRLLEAAVFRDAKRIGTIQSLERYLKEFARGWCRPYPNDGGGTCPYDKQTGGSTYFQEALDLLEELWFKRIKPQDWCSEYKFYLRLFPRGRHAQQSRDAIARLEKLKAIVEIEHPKALTPTGSSWSWTTRFRETGGIAGVRLKKRGEIVDSDGREWARNAFTMYGDITVSAGGSDAEVETFERHGDRYCGGYARFRWTGDDAGCHPVKLSEVVRLNCSGTD